jgi:hypothetical protein
LNQRADFGVEDIGQSRDQLAVASHDGQVFVTLFKVKGKVFRSWLLGHRVFSLFEIETAGNGFERVSHRVVMAAFICCTGMLTLARSAAVGKNTVAKRIFPTYNFWGTIAVTEVTDFEAALLVQSHCSHGGGFILASVEA